VKGVIMNFVWDNTYSVNNELIDSQHEKLLGLFDETYQLLSVEESHYRTIELISELIVYSIFHFSEEEKLMERAGFEGLEAHKREHATFIEKINGFKNDSLENVENLNEEIFLFLADWIITHIQETDSQYIEALKTLEK